MQKFTLTLNDAAAQRIADLVAPYEGSVPGYAAAFADLISQLPVTEQEAIRTQIKTRIIQLQAAGLTAAPKIPAVPPQLEAEARTLLRQVSPQRQPARKRPSRQGKRNDKGAALRVATAHT